MKPELHEFAKSNAWQATIGTGNIDASPDIAPRYNVEAIPTLIVFRDGNPSDPILGYNGKTKLKEMLFGR